MITIDIPGKSQPINITTVLLDLNGTVACDGCLIEGVAERIAKLKEKVDVFLLTADTFGCGLQIAETLGIDFLKVGYLDGNKDKKEFLHRFAASDVAAIGNGVNDFSMLEEAGLSIIIIGPEGCSVKALTRADIAASSINDALDLLLHPMRIRATLRS
ncbi:MAG: ATPase P [Syntrophomonadaceae bacterium]|nr:ATPase P [Syntrophomonadaceae bacterium]